MTISDIASYFLTLVAIALAPGPVVLMLIVRSASKDVAGALGFALGYALGGLLIISIVCFGLGTWLTTVPEVLHYSNYVMMAYILWLAYGVWHSDFDMSDKPVLNRASLLSSICAGVMTCFISPYMMILFPLVLPSMMDITTIELPEFLILSVVTFSALVIGSIIIIALAIQLSRLVREPKTAQFFNRGLASLLVLGGAWMAFG